MLAAVAAVSIHSVTTLDLDVKNSSSVNAAARTLSFAAQSWYTANQSGTPPEAIGTLPQPHYWWQAGALWGAMVDYWAYTNDTSYNTVTSQGLLAQVGPDWNYMPPAYFTSLGNDDQVCFRTAGDVKKGSDISLSRHMALVSFSLADLYLFSRLSGHLPRCPLKNMAFLFRKASGLTTGSILPKPSSTLKPHDGTLKNVAAV